MMVSKAIKETIKWTFRIIFLPFWCLMWLGFWVIEEEGEDIARSAPYFWPPIQDHKFSELLNIKSDGAIISDKEAWAYHRSLTKEQRKAWRKRTGR